MNNFKFSRFNIYSNMDDNLVLFNTKSQKGLVINSEHISIVEEETSSIDMNRDVFKQLYENDMIINSNVDEIEMLKANYFKKIFSNELFTLTIIPTDNCNFACPYCYEEKKKLRMQENIQKNIIKYINLITKKCKKILIIWYGGEPTLEEKTICVMMEQIKEICNKNKTILMSKLITNGYLLNSTAFNQFLNAGIRYFQITLDGNRDRHNNNRYTICGKGSYDTILENLKTMQKTNKKFFVDIRVNIISSDFLSVSELLEDLSNIAKNEKRFNIYFSPIRDWGGESIKNHMNLVTPYSFQLKELYDLAEKKLLNCTLDITKRWMSCELINKHAYVINPEGSVYKCTTSCFQSANKHIVGLINENGLLKLNEKLIASSMETTISDDCSYCKYLPYCMNIKCPYDDMCAFYRDTMCEFLELTLRKVYQNHILSRHAKNT